MTANADQIDYWNAVAGAKWVRDQVRLDRLMAPLSDALFAAADPRPNERVLDVGCGTGDLALRLAAAVGRDGRVDAVDVSRPMLAHAAVREKDADGRHGAIRWIEADAAAHPFAPDHDLLASRFGVMFFDDRPRAFANLRRALRPGGRFAVLTWRGRADVEWMAAPLNWLAPVLPMPDPSDGAVGPFAFADARDTCAMLAAADFGEVTAAPVDAAVVVGADVDDAVAMLSATGPAAALIRDAAPALQAEARRLLREALARRVDGDGMVRLRAACWIYRGCA